MDRFDSENVSGDELYKIAKYAVDKEVWDLDEFMPKPKLKSNTEKWLKKYQMEMQIWEQTKDKGHPYAKAIEQAAEDMDMSADDLLNDIKDLYNDTESGKVSGSLDEQVAKEEMDYEKELDRRAELQSLQDIADTQPTPSENIPEVVSTPEPVKTPQVEGKTKKAQALSQKSEVKYSEAIPEEIINKKPIKVYRWTGKWIGNSTLVKWQYFADSKKFASTFWDVTEFEIPKGSKIFDLDSVKYGDGSIPKELLVDQDKLTDYIINKWYDYTKNTNSRGVEYVKLNKAKSSMENLARNSKTLSEFKEKVMSKYDEFRDEIARLSKNYTNADNSRMRSPMEDIWNNLNK